MKEVSLREYLEMRIDSVEKISKLQHRTRDLALRLQATEINRRLDNLNHAHEQNIARNAEFISKEKFESFTSEFQTYKETTSKALTLAQGSSQGIGKLTAIIVGAFSFLLLLLMIVGCVISMFVFFNSSTIKKLEHDDTNTPATSSR